MLCDVERKMSICGLTLGFITAVVSCVNPNSTTSLNRVPDAPMSDKQLCKQKKENETKVHTKKTKPRLFSK